MLGPPINGWIFEATDYNICFYVSGGFLLVAGLISCVVDVLKRRQITSEIKVRFIKSSIDTYLHILFLFRKGTNFKQFNSMNTQKMYCKSYSHVFQLFEEHVQFTFYDMNLSIVFGV